MTDFFIKSKYFQNRDKVRYTGKSTERIRNVEIFSVRFGRADGWIKVVRLRPDGKLHYAVIWHELLTHVKARTDPIRH